MSRNPTHEELAAAEARCMDTLTIAYSLLHAPADQIVAALLAAEERGKSSEREECAEIAGMAVIDAEIDVFRVGDVTLKNTRGHNRFISTIEVSRILKERAESIRARASLTKEP